MASRKNSEIAADRERSDKELEMQQLIQFSRQEQVTIEQTQLPDGRFENVPFFDPAATYYSK